MDPTLLPPLALGMSRSGSGPFVYAGSGKKQAKNADVCQRRCITEACGIQICLQRSNHVQARCEHIIDVYKACCEKARQDELEGSASTAMPVKSNGTVKDGTLP